MGFMDAAFGAGHRTPTTTDQGDAQARADTRAAAEHRRPPSRREQEDLVFAELLDLLRQRRATDTAAAAERRANLNGVLDVATGTFDSAGVISLAYPVAVGSVVVTNPNATSVTVSSSPAQGTAAPTTGRGVQVVPASSWLGIPIGSHTVTLYGAVGATVSWQTFTGLQALGVYR